MHALLDQITDMFFTNAGNINVIAIPEVEALGTIVSSSKVSIGISLDSLRRLSLLSKTSGISDAEDSKQNEQAEDDGGGFHLMNYFLLYFEGEG